jgi:hypothetical protein
MWTSRGILRQAGLLSRATASNRCRKNIGLLKLSSYSVLYRRVGFSFFLFYRLNKHTLVLNDVDFVSSLNIGKRASRYCWNTSSLGSAS